MYVCTTIQNAVFLYSFCTKLNCCSEHIPETRTDFPLCWSQYRNWP